MYGGNALAVFQVRLFFNFLSFSSSPVIIYTRETGGEREGIRRRRRRRRNPISLRKALVDCYDVLYSGTSLARKEKRAQWREEEEEKNIGVEVDDAVSISVRRRSAVGTQRATE